MELRCCPFCDWEMIRGKYSNFSSPCNFQCKGYTQEDRSRNAQGCALGRNDPEVSQEPNYGGPVSYE